jgi:hypothetical protein
LVSDTEELFVAPESSLLAISQFSMLVMVQVVSLLLIGVVGDYELQHA